MRVLAVLGFLFLLLLWLLIPYWIAPTVDKKPFVNGSLGEAQSIETTLDSSPLEMASKPNHTSGPFVTSSPVQSIIPDIIPNPVFDSNFNGVFGVFSSWDYVPNREFFDLMKSLEKKYSTLEGMLEAMSGPDPVYPNTPVVVPPISLPPVILNPSPPLFQSPN